MPYIRVSTDRSLLDIDLIYTFLHEEAPWSKGIPRMTVEKAIRNSLCFGAYLDDPEHRQVGFARMITDYATFGNLVDVFVVSEYRGTGVSRRLLDAVNAHPDLQGLRRMTLATSDRQSLYAKFGYKALSRPETFMERYDPRVYSTTPDLA